MFKNYRQILIFLSATLLFTACSIKEPIIEQPQPKISDLELLATTANDDSIDSQKASKDFFDKYFKPWSATKVSFSKIEAMWGQSYKSKKVYLENHQLATKEWFDKQIENSNFDDYNTLAKKAITLKNVNIRVIPTNSPPPITSKPVN